MHTLAKLPVTIVTGFLGSGKTTLLKRLLTEAHGQKIAVIENEFGEENIDNDILVTESQEQIVQMSNGCICCTIREDLRETLQLLAAKRRKGLLDFDRIVIETPGGKREATVLVRHGIMPGVVAIEHGYGHRELGARAHRIGSQHQPEVAGLDAGVNLNDLGLADPTVNGKSVWVDPVSGTSVRQGIPARISKA